MKYIDIDTHKNVLPMMMGFSLGISNVIFYKFVCFIISVYSNFNKNTDIAINYVEVLLNVTTREKYHREQQLERASKIHKTAVRTGWHRDINSTGSCRALQAIQPGKAYILVILWTRYYSCSKKDHRHGVLNMQEITGRRIRRFIQTMYDLAVELLECLLRKPKHPRFCWRSI